MRPGPSPLVGYNTNVRHKGKLYHIQTEDSGVNHPHVITHLFADGGRIIASRKTAYGDHVGAKDLAEIVKKLMQEQHKAMFIELRDCVYDEDGPGAHGTPAHAPAQQLPANPAAPASAAKVSDTDRPPPARASRPAAPVEELDIDALERAAAARLAESAASRAKSEAPRRGAGRYQHTVPAHTPVRESIKPKPSASIFGGEALRGKSLDEVILSYLSDDVGDGKR
jgi:hypothetical protein